MRYIRWLGAAAYLLPSLALAQPQQPSEGAKLPAMELEQQFAGPLQDTIIQRWRDPIDGTVCYLYLPIRVVHSTPTASGYVQYGSSTIGSISCVAGASAEVLHPKAFAPTVTTFVGLIIQLIAGIVGGNAAGAALREYSLGLVGNTIVGAVGGLAGGQLLQFLFPAISGAAGVLDVWAILNQSAAGGITGLVCSLIGGVVKSIVAGGRRMR